MEKRAWVEIDLNRIYRNVIRMKKFTRKKFMVCVKANCYGMGVEPIAQKIESIVDYFGIATVEVGIELREAGIKKPILILSTISPEDVEEVVKNNLSITLCNKEILRKTSDVVRKTGLRANVHINVDTGMGRVGIKPEETVSFVEEVSRQKRICIEGIFSHFATAEWKDKKYAIAQLEKFKAVLIKIEGKINIPLKHIANSGAILNLPQTYREFDLVRVGLLILGVYPEKHLGKNLPLECALKGYTRVLFVKEVPAGTPLSYGISFTTKRKTKIATLGVGYADGLRRALSNKFYLKFKKEKIKIIGNICMDQSLIDITGKNIKIGDRIEIFGDNFEIENMAKIAQTVPQEILCGFGNIRMKKVYKNVPSPLVGED